MALTIKERLEQLETFIGTSLNTHLLAIDVWIEFVPTTITVISDDLPSLELYIKEGSNAYVLQSGSFTQTGDDYDRTITLVNEGDYTLKIIDTLGNFTPLYKKIQVREESVMTPGQENLLNVLNTLPDLQEIVDGIWNKTI
jgi:hypothetical protein